MTIYNNRLDASFNRQGAINWPSILGIGLALFVIAIIFMFRPNQPDGGDGLAGADETPSAVVSPQNTPVVAEPSPQAQETPVDAAATPATAAPNPSAETDDNTGSTEPATSTPIQIALSTAIATFTPASSDAVQNVPATATNLPQNNETPQAESQDASPIVEPTFTPSPPPSATIAVNQEEEKTENALSVPTETSVPPTITAEPQPSATVPPTEAPAAKPAAAPTEPVPPTEPPAATPVPPTEPPSPTAVPPTEPPPPTAPPPTAIPPTAIPPTPVPPTPIPPTPIPPTYTPTQVPPTYTPTRVPPTPIPPTPPPGRNIRISLLAPTQNQIVKNNEVQFRVEVNDLKNGDRLQLRASIDQNNLFNEGISFTFDGEAYVANLNYRPGNAGFGKDYYWQVVVFGPDGTTLATSNISQFRWEEPN